MDAEVVGFFPNLITFIWWIMTYFIIIVMMITAGMFVLGPIGKVWWNICNKLDITRYRSESDKIHHHRIYSASVIIVMLCILTLVGDFSTSLPRPHDNVTYWYYDLSTKYPTPNIGTWYDQVLATIFFYYSMLWWKGFHAVCHVLAAFGIPTRSFNINDPLIFREQVMWTAKLVDVSFRAWLFGGFFFQFWIARRWEDDGHDIVFWKDVLDERKANRLSDD